MTLPQRTFAAIAATIGSEGGFQRDPQDRGNWTSGVIGRGELRGTKWGISAMSYPGEDIPNLTQERAFVIYERDFWNKLAPLPPGVCYMAFDFAVNSGLRTSIRALQEAAGTVPDGLIGPATRAAVARHTVTHKATDELLRAYSAERAFYYSQIRTVNRFGKGWMIRAFEVHDRAQDFARRFADRRVEPYPDNPLEA